MRTPTSSRRSSRVLAPIFLALCASLALACGDGDGPTGPPPDTDPFDGTATIGAEGGVMGLGETVLVEIPPGVLEGELQLFIEAVATPADLVADEAIGQAYRIGPASAALAGALRVSIVVPPAAREGRPVDAITILRSDAATSDLAPAAQELQDVRRDAGGTVSGETGQLGVFSAALVENRPPTVDAGPDQSVDVGATVSMAATTSDPDGDPVSVGWSLAARPDGSESEVAADGAGASLVPDVAGTYVVVATATDDRGGSATASVAVDASPPPGAVVADAGPDQTVNVGATVTLDGTGSSGDGLAFSWRILSAPGSTPSLTGATTAQPSFKANDVGEYLVELEVTDGDATDQDVVRVNVVQPNRAPTVTLSGPTAVLVGANAVVSATASDPDGDALAFTFDLTRRPASSAAALTSSGSNALFTADVVGRYGVAVTASDGSLSSEAETEVYGNPDVAGTYSATFELNSFTSSCPDDLQTGNTEATMTVEQSSQNPSRVTLLLSELDDQITTDADGTLLGTDFDYSGPLTVVDSEGNPLTLNANFSGEITGDGILDLETTLSVFTCQIEGTIQGTRQ